MAEFAGLKCKDSSGVRRAGSGDRCCMDCSNWSEFDDYDLDSGYCSVHRANTPCDCTCDFFDEEVLR